MEAKNKRYFHRIATGQKIARLHKRRIRFMTLTTSDEAKSLDISRDWDVLLKRIRRKDSSFQYCKVLTNEGNGVIHILYTGKYLSQKWISYNWNKIHASYVVDIRECSNDRSIASYVVNQYLSNQKCTYTRMSYSKRWMFPKAVFLWKNLVRCVKSRYHYNPIQEKYYKNKIEVPFSEILFRILSLWEDIIYNNIFIQQTFFDYG